MSLTGLPEIKVRLIKGSSHMAGLFQRCVFSNDNSYWFECNRKTPTKHKRVFELHSTSELEMGFTLRYAAKSTVFRVSRIRWADDPETCWRIEWEAYGLHYRIQWFYKKFIDMEVDSDA